MTQYMDNTVFFLRRSINLDVRLRRYLCIFSLISGLWIHRQKSVMVGVRVDKEEVH